MPLKEPTFEPKFRHILHPRFSRLELAATFKGNTMLKLTKNTILPILAALISLMYFSTVSPAQTATLVKGLDHTFSAGIGMGHMDYEEDVPSPYKSELSGTLPSLYMKYTYDRLNSIYFSVIVEYSKHDLKYDGTTIDENESFSFDKSFDDSQEYRRYEGNIGYTFNIAHYASISPYTGLGYRTWDRSTDKDVVGYEGEYKWVYLPVGVKLILEPGNNWRIEPNLAYRLMLDGETEINGTGLEFNLGNENGWHADVAVKYYFSHHWGIELTPWYEKMKLGKSNVAYGVYENVVYSVYEPESDTTQYGINLGVIFSF